MSKLNNFIFNKEQSTVTVGVALTWDQVYEKGDPLNITVAGGRIKGVGKYEAKEITYMISLFG